jgi:microcin C transport system substrate-binding protein
MELTFASLMARSGDEPDAMYGFAARAVRISADGLTYRFAIRPDARFHDGSPLTAQDVAFSLMVLKEKGHPIITQLLRDFAGCEATDDTTATVRFAPKRARDVPLFVGGLPIFSRAYYAQRPFDESTLDIPLGSGPYQVGRFEAGRYIEYKRVPNWWGATCRWPRAEQLRHRALRILPRPRRRLRGFTPRAICSARNSPHASGRRAYDFRRSRMARQTRRHTRRHAVRRAGLVHQHQAAKFGNPKLREALGYAFDFEWTNKSIMYVPMSARIRCSRTPT